VGEGGAGGDAPALAEGKVCARSEKSFELGAHDRRAATSAGRSMKGSHTSAAMGMNDAGEVSPNAYGEPAAPGVVLLPPVWSVPVGGAGRGEVDARARSKSCSGERRGWAYAVPAWRERLGDAGRVLAGPRRGEVGDSGRLEVGVCDSFSPPRPPKLEKAKLMRPPPPPASPAPELEPMLDAEPWRRWLRLGGSRRFRGAWGIWLGCCTRTMVSVLLELRRGLWFSVEWAPHGSLAATEPRREDSRRFVGIV
jgi:hypothetical protein